MSRHAISTAGLTLIREYEGFRSEPAQLPDGNWVVGHGHVRIGEPGSAVNENEASDLLGLDLAPVELFVNEKVASDITQSQFDALVSFAYSVGPDSFEKSDVLRRTNTGDFVPAACAMDAWRKSDVTGKLEVIDALIRRRAAEKALYLKDGTHDASPSVFMRAKIDHAAAILGAPVKYAAAPAVGSVPVLQQAEPAARIVEILKSEPATEQVLLLTEVANDFGPEEGDDEITTAHAKPVSRVLVDGRIALKRAADHAAEQTKARPQKRIAAPSADVIGFVALTLFGLALVALGGWTFLDGVGDIVDIMAATALTLPGLAAISFGLIGFIRRPAPSRI